MTYPRFCVARWCGLFALLGGGVAACTTPTSTPIANDASNSARDEYDAPTFSRSGEPEARGWPNAHPQSNTPSDETERAAGAPAEADYTVAARPARKPGLGTEWGERRRSAVFTVPFQRQSPARPFSTLAFYYDDAQSVEWQTGRDPDDAGPSIVSVAGGALDISLVTPRGTPLPQLVASGRTFVIGEDGDRYAIRIRNHTPDRFEVVASVDGLDVLDGGEAEYAKRGYVVGPWATVNIEGFRESIDHVRAFRFGELEDSYAIQRGYGRDVGVVGLALFDERAIRPRPPAYNSGSSHVPSPFPKEFAPAPVQ